MTGNQSLSYAGLPAGTWWLIAVSGLMVLAALMIFSEQEPIESDLEQRIMEFMTSEKIDWVSVELEGRDVLLTGNAPSVESRGLVIEMVTGVHGVRVVDHRVDIKASMNSPELSIQQEDGRVLLGGQLESQASVDAVVKAARASYGNENVVNELIVSGEVKTAKWLAGSTGLLPTLVGTKSAHLKVSDNESLLSAEVESHGKRLALVNQARKLLGDNLDADITVTDLTGRAGTQADNVKLQSGDALRDSVLAACQSKIDARMKDKKILFASNTAELESSSHALLDQIIGVLNECNDVVLKNKLTIAGHTDSVGDDGYNLALSQRRADVVKAYIVNAATDVGLITSVGLGESQPVEPNDTDEGRAQNRRIEFKLESQ